MAILTLQFGQCGNQVGHSLFTYLANDIKYEPQSKQISAKTNLEYRETAINQWFYENKTDGVFFTPRTVLIDTENKVISSVTRDKSLLKYKNIISKCEGGSANNWAYGYTEKSLTIKENLLELVRHEVEKCDDILHILSILSSAGGTGSGVGSAIIESLREEYKNKTMFNLIILPYNEGEVVTQNYNTLLTLAKLYDLTDGTILLENAQLHKVCTKLLAVKEVNLTHINLLISQKMAGLFQPAKDSHLSDVISHLTSHPSYKFIQIKTTPHIPEEYIPYETVQGWPILVNHMRNGLRIHNYWETKHSVAPVASYPGLQFCRSVGSVLISRGGSIPEQQSLQTLLESDLYAPWLPEDGKLKHYHQIRNLQNTTNFLTLATNNSSIAKSVDSVIEEAWNLYNHKAYLHQYEQFGVTADAFKNAFVKLESVIHSYNSL